MTVAATTATPADRLFRRVLTALALGVAVGLFLGEYVWPLKIVSDVYVKLLQVTVLPYVLGSVIAGLGAHTPEDGKRLAIRGGVMLLLFWGAAFVIVMATSLAYPEGRSSSVFVADLPPPCRSTGSVSTSRRTSFTRWPSMCCPRWCCSASSPAPRSAA